MAGKNSTTVLDVNIFDTQEQEPNETLEDILECAVSNENQDINVDANVSNSNQLDNAEEKNSETQLSTSVFLKRDELVKVGDRVRIAHNKDPLYGTILVTTSISYAQDSEVMGDFAQITHISIERDSRFVKHIKREYEFDWNDVLVYIVPDHLICTRSIYRRPMKIRLFDIINYSLLDKTEADTVYNMTNDEKFQALDIEPKHVFGILPDELYGCDFSVNRSMIKGMQFALNSVAKSCYKKMYWEMLSMYREIRKRAFLNAVDVGPQIMSDDKDDNLCI